MSQTKSVLFCVLLFSALRLHAVDTAPVAPPQKTDASLASPKDSERFLQRHEAFLARGKSGPIGLLFLGDSITQGWEKVPHIWNHYYGKHTPANFGISGDKTQHVIWRLENGELDGIHPKVVVLMLGTNNTAAYSAAEIAAADRKIVEIIRSKIPAAKVLLLGIFPRGQRDKATGKVSVAGDRLATIKAVNAELAKLDDGEAVRYLDIGAVFLGQDGLIPSSIAPDQLHPSAAGYQLWADAMQPLLTEMVK